MRIGNSVGLKPFSNTNRKNPKYSKSKRKQAKAIKAFLETLTTGVNDGNTEAANPAEQTAS